MPNTGPDDDNRGRTPSDRERPDRDRGSWDDRSRYIELAPGQRGERGRYDEDDRGGRFGRGDEERFRGGGYSTERGYGGGQSGYAAGYTGPQPRGRGEGAMSSGSGFGDHGGANTGYDDSAMGYGSLGAGADAPHDGSLGYGSSMGNHRGKGPVGYSRSDERIREDVCDALTDDDRIDASGIEISVKAGEVTLTGHVPDRRTKRMAEDRIASRSGVKDVCNNLEVQTDASSQPKG